MLHINLSKDDSTLEDTFAQIADKVATIKKQDLAALISCEKSTGLAATMCLAYLLKYEGVGVKAATKVLKERRPNAVLDQLMIVKLEAWQKKLWRQQFLDSLLYTFMSWLPLLLLLGLLFFLLKIFQREMEKIYEEGKKTPEYEYFDILKWP